LLRLFHALVTRLRSAKAAWDGQGDSDERVKWDKKSTPAKPREVHCRFENKRETGAMETTSQAHDNAIKLILLKVDGYGMAQTSLKG
jgi:hypothetical protein